MPACAELPEAVTAGSGFVGVRCPKHALAVELSRWLERHAFRRQQPCRRRHVDRKTGHAQRVCDCGAKRGLKLRIGAVFCDHFLDA